MATGVNSEWSEYPDFAEEPIHMSRDAVEAMLDWWTSHTHTANLVIAKRKVRSLLDHLEKCGYVVVDSATLRDLEAVYDAASDMPGGDDFIEAVLEA